MEKNFCEAVVVYSCGVVDDTDAEMCRHYHSDDDLHCAYMRVIVPGIVRCQSEAARKEASQ